MTDNVVQIDTAKKEREAPTIAGKAQCLCCQHHWVAVAPVGTVGMECPACGTERGVWTYPVHESGFAWHCQCGSSIFNLTPHGALCCGCGLRHAYEDL